MKKLISLTLALLCICIAIPAAQAAGKTYEFPEFNMAINAPKGWYVLTRSVKEGDSAIKALGMTGHASELANQFKQYGIYLDMINKEYTQIALVMQDSGDTFVGDFSDMDDEIVLQIASQAKEIGDFTGGQFTVTSTSVYKNKQAKYALINYTAFTNGMKVYGSIYLTMKNGKTIAVMMMSRTKVSKSLKQTLKSTVDSIVFKRFPVFPSKPGTYDLNELNMKINSPAGWYVSTRDVKDDDPNLDLMGMEKTGLADYYKENGIYFFLVSSDLNAGIYVNMKNCSDDPQYVDFNYCSDEYLLQQAPEMVGKETLLDSSVYTHEQTKFVVLHTDNHIRYETQINGQVMSVSMTLHKGKITDSLKQTLKSVVDGIEFKKVSSKPGALEAATHELPELNLKIGSPKGWCAFTRDVGEENPSLVFLGMDSKELSEFYKERDIYLNMISEATGAHIFVSMRETDGSLDIYDYNDLADDDLLKMLSEAAEAKEVVIDISVYKHKQAKFTVINSTNEKGYGRIYQTVINGQAISVGLESTGEISDSLKQTLQDTVDSIDFTEVASKPALSAPGAATYDLPELNMKVDSPEGWFVFTRDVKEDDPNLKALRLDGKDLAQQYKDGGIYLGMISADPYAEINVIMTDTADTGGVLDDFNNMDDDGLRTVAYMEMVRIGAQPDISDISVYTHKQTKFAVLDFTDTSDGKTVYAKVYFTVINGQAVSIMMISPKAEISDSYAQALKDTVDGITFTKGTPVDDSIAVLACLAGAAAGAVIGAAVISIRKRRYA